MARHDAVYFNQYSLLVVDVPPLDDSVASVTWAVWITTETPDVPSTVHRAYAWNNCARGRRRLRELRLTRLRLTRLCLR